jgi:hypothetical protein
LICYLCGGAELSVREGVVRDAPSLKVLECRNCGLVMLSSVEHVEPGHYETSGMHGQDLPSMDSWLRETEQDDQRRFEMLKGSITNRRLLDFGCGAAGFLRKASILAAEAVGVEPELRVRQFWGNQLTLKDSVEHAGSGYDLITAFHVIEHLPDPIATLKQLGGLLGLQGRLVVEVPSSEDALLTLYESAAFRRFTYWSQHLFLFNAETLRRLATGAGLQVISIQQFQRYPISNHLHWLSRNQPGGHRAWSFIDTPALNEAYSASLAALGKCDTLIAHLSKIEASH